MQRSDSVYHIGDYIVKSNAGVCRIENILHLDMTNVDKGRLYYLMVPNDNERTKLYVPVDGKNSRMRRVVSESQAWEVLDKIPEMKAIKIPSEKQRELEYKEAIRSCELEQLISLLKTIYQRRQKRIAQGKKKIAIDEYYLKIAENNLYSELAFVTGKSQEQIRKLVLERLNGRVVAMM
jgi:CarD family transcriptional regulator